MPAPTPRPDEPHGDDRPTFDAAWIADATRRDLTADFPTTPDQDAIRALSARLGPAARAGWTGAQDATYVDGYLWRYDDGAPGTAVRRFLCTASLAGYSPFTGTLHA